MKIALLLLLIFSATTAKSVYIFYPFLSKLDTLKFELEKQYPNDTIQIFGKYTLLAKKMEVQKSDILLSTSVVVNEFSKNYPIIKHGVKDSSIFESYMLVSFKKNISNYETMKIGSVNYGNRDETKKLVEQLLSLENASVKRVTKIDDLVSLLRFNIIDCAVIKKHEFQYLQNYTRQKLFKIELENSSIPIITIGANNEKNLDDFLKNGNDFNTFIGVDSWEK